ncbi:hypothetical protein WJX74_005084 [Apatococcus lobatus]|uniref:Uncharacterized protein n=1 Tax=Apatococcus lobatus TaxID=904363 RepID=A0AAW1Q5G1_9CHLO
MSPETVSGVVLSVLTASAAILAVFVVVGSPVERRIVQEQTAAVIHDLLKDAPLLGDAEAPLAAYVRSMATPDMTAADAASRAANTALLRKAVLMVGACLVAGFAAVRVWSARAGFAFGPVLRRALVSCLLAAGTETAFLLLVARHFVSADPQAVRLMILEALEKDAA